MKLKGREEKACIFCSRKLNLGDVKQEFHCTCGGHYFVVDQGTAEAKISCPSCDRHIAIDSGAFDRKIVKIRVF